MTDPARPQVDVRRAAERFATRLPWLDSASSFSFGRHYDPGNLGHGLLLVHNDDVVQPGSGFASHPHRDMEILTWVLRGSLVHQDSTGHRGILHPGLAQRMTAGRGIVHSERNDPWPLDGERLLEPVHVVQMWVVPDEVGVDPGYEQAEVGDALAHGDLVPVASGRPQHDAAVRIRNRHAALHVARLQPGQSVQLPEAPFLHLSVPQGAAELEGAGGLGAGDAVRFTGTGGQRLTATAPTELLVWEMHASRG